MCYQSHFQQILKLRGFDTTATICGFKIAHFINFLKQEYLSKTDGIKLSKM